ncbi:hypothetical protein [Nocardia brasiliensis]|uniref:hypothetical protein n=1 Tax=Nocardia brasiliensis TaxID=37326 RepID=UPI002457E73C|nr:hypothetical protein [Nocardia brasiliensis]
MSAAADQVARARLTVARFTGDAEQCRTVLDMLGLLPDQVDCAGTCGRRMIRKRHPDTPPPGWARRKGPGCCLGCYQKMWSSARQEAAPPRPPRGKAARPEFQTRAVELRAQGLTWATVAARLECSPRTARAAVVRAEGGQPWRQRPRVRT